MMARFDSGGIVKLTKLGLEFGMRLSVAGYGTRYGLYVESARPADPASPGGPGQLRGARD